MPVTVVRYRTRPERADENQALVEAVFAEFVREIDDRCADGPHASGATLVGGYGFASETATPRG
jgi:hypothetical protein